MKTNNVDFGKTFKFICPEDDTIFTYTKMGEEYCKVSWHDCEGDYEERKYTTELVRSYITSGDWTVLADHEDVTVKIEDNLLNEIKAFTTTSKHSVNIYNGAYEVFRSGEDMAYQCKDDETLKSVMQALKILDSVIVDE